MVPTDVADPPVGHEQPPVPWQTVLHAIAPGAEARSSKRLLLYLHVPFCAAKCHFCDWVVGYEKSDLRDAGLLRDRYIRALIDQIRLYGPALARWYVPTNIYWGGGTPTRLAPEQIARIDSALRSVFDLTEVKEFTAECSPETVTSQHLEVWQERGLNRISVGVQSFDDTVLRRMGRPHSSEDALRCLELFRQAGLNNVNVDLIVGYPDESADSVLGSVATAIEMSVQHVSLYMFREFARDLVATRGVQAGWRKQTSRAERAALYLAAKGLLEKAGYEEYLVGYFARRPEFAFDGERYYFSMLGDYFGFGAGASSTVGRHALRSGAPSRYGAADVRAFIRDPGSLLACELSAVPDAVLIETYFKVFATPEGLLFDRWRDQFGQDFGVYRARRPAIRQWFADREREGGRFIETETGIRLSPDTWIPTMIWRQ